MYNIIMQAKGYRASSYRARLGAYNRLKERVYTLNLGSAQDNALKWLRNVLRV